MKYIMWFVKVRFFVLKNSLWRDKKTVAKTLSITLAIIIGQILLTNIIYRNIFNNISASDEMIKALLNIFFFATVIWIYSISFIQSISAFVRNFYKSPDMNYLVSIPVPFNHIFLIKFLEHIINSTKSMLFLFFPFLAALGIWANAPVMYYFVIIPFYIFITIIPCAIGAIVAMSFLKIVSAKIFNIMTSIIAFAINIFFAIFFSRAQEILEPFLTKLVEFFEKPWISELVPLTAAVKLLNYAVVGKWPLYAVLFLLISTSICLLIAFVISKKIYFAGWVKNQVVESQNNKKRTVFVDNYKKSHANEITTWIKSEWKMAIRNHEMLISSAFMLFFFLFTIFTFIYGNLFSDSPMVGVSLLVTIAAIFNIIAVSMLFIPVDTKKDKSLWKTRYWLLKILPLEGAKVFTIQCNMFFIPGCIISFAGIIAYSVFVGLSFHLLLLSLLVLFFILYGSSAIYTSVELLSLSDFFENNEFLGNLITVLFPLAYGLLSAGSITLFLAGDILSDIIILSDISAVLSLPVAGTISAVTVFLALVFPKIIFAKVWENLEI